VRIAEEITKAARETAKAERLRNDTAYQERRAAEAGHIQRPRAGQKQSGQSPAPAMAPIALEKPEKPEETPAAFLTRWDAWIRAANFGELILAVATLIFIRNRSARYNAQARRDDEDFPDELDVDVIEKRSPTRRENFTQKKETAMKHASFSFEGLKRLREVLRDISFRLPGLSFKSYVRGAKSS